MLVTFHSDAAADVIMFGDVAKTLLQILGKDATQKTGIFEVDALPAGIAQLRKAVSESRATPQAREAEKDVDESPTGMDSPVNIAQRAFPLLEMFERSLAARVPIIWE